jgi:hypothetical protein
MVEISDKGLRDLMSKYQSKIDKELNNFSSIQQKPIFSREYQEFKQEMMPIPLTIYEKLCNQSEKLVKIKPKPEKEAKLKKYIEVSHLNITPAGAASFAVLGPILFMIISALFSILLTNGVFFTIVSLFTGLILISILSNAPNIIANNHRMKASNQMVLCVFYIVTYMRHTSNLENAINFAAEHLDPPLSLDMKKILWDVETKKFDSIKDSVDTYLETWREWNIEFIEAFHLIESSLYEPSEQRRIELLDRSLDVILEETYEKMLHYAHDLQSPITMLHMLGIVMPILGLVVLPLVVSFMENVRWYHLSILYNVLLPLGIFYLAKNILSTRPTGYGDNDISESNKGLKKYRNVIIPLGPFELKINPFWISLFIGVTLFLIGLSPPIIHLILPGKDFGFGEKDQKNTLCNGHTFCFLEYKPSKAKEGPSVGTMVGPYGLGASLLSLAIPLSLGLGFGLFFKLRSQNVIKIREKTKRLEKEFSSSLFQLGNRLGDGIPAELAFERVATAMQGTTSGSFFAIVSNNIKRLGMSVKDSIFNRKTGALIYFPSKVIESSMKVLIVSVRKGPKVAAQALVNVARYIKEIHRVDERLRDLMADTISSMKSQIKFLTPVVSGIVIGITSMISTILGKLGNMFPETGDAGATAIAGASRITQMFGDGVPPYYFQIVVGIYVVQVIYILTLVTNGIENGSDKLSERYNLGNNLTNSVIFYSIVAFIVMVVFNMIAGKVLLNTVAGG